ncbi:unnamed protein product [Caenorhabditis auriculariae]|uniref:Uncharacterized protein n=1 Tax=Caenorhabditis auriculariae TaxID=2777116 RepID=A0A8S1HRN5_9PELO|nr:unnamed protein product [Caenorhabditis auriculariae]
MIGEVRSAQSYANGEQTVLRFKRTLRSGFRYFRVRRYASVFKMKVLAMLMLLVAVSWTLLEVVDSSGVPARRLKRQYYGYGGYGYGYNCNCGTYAPCPHYDYGGYDCGCATYAPCSHYGYYGGYGGYGYKK